MANRKRPCRGRCDLWGIGNKHPKHFLFFTQTSNGQAAADDFLRRLKERTKDLDAPVRDETVQAQLAAIHAWGQGDATRENSAGKPDFDIRIRCREIWRCWAAGFFGR